MVYYQSHIALNRESRYCRVSVFPPQANQLKIFFLLSIYIYITFEREIEYLEDTVKERKLNTVC